MVSCPECQRTFSSKGALRSHCRAKGHDASMYYCSECKRSFSDAQALEQHLENSPIHRATTCYECDRSFSSPQGLEQHLKNAPVHQALTCQECNRLFSSSQALEMHLKDSPVHRATTCYQCDKRFSSVQALEQHLNNSPVHRGTTCYECDRHFSSAQALEMHLDNSPAHQPFCHSCNRGFGSQAALRRHLDTSLRHRGTVVLYQNDRAKPSVMNSFYARHSSSCECPLCRKSFGAPSAVAQHVESGACHNISRHQVTAAVKSLEIIPSITISRRLKGPVDAQFTIIRSFATQGSFNGFGYVCSMCTKSFRTLGSLEMHLNSPAHDQRQFQCPKCKKQVKLVSGLIQHIESESCGIAKFKQVADIAGGLMNSFTRRLTA
jgi:hypothetical protein